VEREGTDVGRGIRGVIGGVCGGCASRIIPGSCGDEETLLGTCAVVDIDVSAPGEGQARGCCGRGGDCPCPCCCSRCGGHASRRLGRARLSIVSMNRPGMRTILTRILWDSS